MNEEMRKTISDDDLRQKLFQFALEGTADMAFYLGVACGRIHQQEKEIRELKAIFEREDLKMEGSA